MQVPAVTTGKRQVNEATWKVARDSAGDDLLVRENNK